MTKTAIQSSGVNELARAAKSAARVLAKAAASTRRDALAGVAAALRRDQNAILEANRADLEAGESAGLTTAMLDRLRLDGDRLEAMARAVDEISAMDEIVGRIDSHWTRPNGLSVERVRIPLGVIAMVYEARPNVTSDAAALCIKSGNAVILRGGKEALQSNLAIGAAISRAVSEAGLPPAAVQVLPTADRQTFYDLLACDGEIDLVIPRGGEGLIRAVVEHSRIPVLKHYKGVCHAYVHAGANLDMALAICENGKVHRPGVCNAVETILIDAAIASAFVPRLCSRFAELGVEIRGDDRTRELGGSSVKNATDDDWGAEYLDTIVAVKVVEHFDDAVAHIERYGSDHTETIVTEDEEAAERFTREVGSSTVMINASTRFADGGQLGLGAEIGISTTRLHAYGPMGAEGLTTTKFVVRGHGQVRT